MNIMVIFKILKKKDAKDKFEVPSYLQKDKPFRFVKLIQEDKGCPCGGTHV